MAVPHRHGDARLSARSERALARAEFFQTVRAIAAAAGATVGDDTRAAAEPVRFRVGEGMRHPDREVVALARPAAGGPVEVTVGHMGLTGPMGVMPDHYSDLVTERRRERDEALAQFLNLFNHRAISHFYRAWAKYRLPVRFEEDRGRLNDPFSRTLAALAGLARVDDPAMLAAAGPLSRPVRSAGSLRRVVEALFALPVTVEELRPRRIRIADADRSRVGSAARPHGAFTALSRDVVLGGTAMDAGGGFRLRLGPLDRATFEAFFDADGLRARLVEAVRFAVGGTIDFDLQLVLRAQEVPAARLCAQAPVRLSQAAWLLARPAARDRDDAVLPSVLSVPPA